VELLVWRARARARLIDPDTSIDLERTAEARSSEREAVFADVGRIGVPVVREAELTTEPFNGPAIVESAYGTTVIPPALSLRVSHGGGMTADLTSSSRQKGAVHA
jgi:hypothetical protein